MKHDWRNQETEKAMKPGELLLLSFEEEAGAGYLWSAQSPDGLEMRKTTVPAVQGIRSFNHVSFSATLEKPGKYEVTFTHKRPADAEADRTIRYILSVSPS